MAESIWSISSIWDKGQNCSGVWGEERGALGGVDTARGEGGERGTRCGLGCGCC